VLVYGRDSGVGEKGRKQDVKRVQPRVFLVGESSVNSRGLENYFNYIGTSWRPQKDVSDSEALVEVFGRLCYRSWEVGMNPNVSKVRSGNAAYLENILESGHGAVIEHATTNWIFANVSRVFTHELVRHRVGVAYSQESLRYVRLSDLGLWLPPEVKADEELSRLFETTFENLEQLQLKMSDYLKLDEAKFAYKKKMTSAMRRIAPIGLATTIGVSLNFRALRHLMSLRTSVHAEVEIREVMRQVMEIVVKRYPNLFQDVRENTQGEWVPRD
jgi:thymidylate synthase (FAD)